MLKEEDFKFLKILEKRLYTLKEREELISTLYYFVRTIWSVRRKIKNDIWVIRNINPYCIKADYSQYILDETKHFVEGDKYWPIIRDVLKYPMNEEMLKEMLGDYHSLSILRMKHEQKQTKIQETHLNTIPPREALFFLSMKF